MLAYIDPGAGSFVFQALVASVAGAAVLLKTYWKRLRVLFGASRRDDGDSTAGPPPNADE